MFSPPMTMIERHGKLLYDERIKKYNHVKVVQRLKRQKLESREKEREKLSSR